MQRLLFIIICFVTLDCAWPCTSAIVSGKVTANGRPMLWKHRDTGTEDNFVQRVVAARPGELDYVALFNAGDSLLAEAWIGLNSAGFAVMNTASYNLVPDTAVYRDREGYVMTLALKQCRSLADFEMLLDTLSRPMGVQANFGAIDASGAGAYYETCDDGYVKYDLADDPDGVLVRTNYSCSGASDTGFGYIREANACHLLSPYVTSASVEPATFTEVLSRSFYHSMLKCDALAGDPEWIIDQDFIPRNSSSASIVIEGLLPGESPESAVMWSAVGYPPCSYVLPVTVTDVPEELQPSPSTWRSKLCDDVVARKRKVFPVTRGSGSHYINVEALRHYNDSCRQVSLENYRINKELLNRK